MTSAELPVIIGSPTRRRVLRSASAPDFRLPWALFSEAVGMATSRHRRWRKSIQHQARFAPAQARVMLCTPFPRTTVRADGLRPVRTRRVVGKAEDGIRACLRTEAVGWCVAMPSRGVRFFFAMSVATNTSSAIPGPPSALSLGTSALRLAAR